MCELILSHVAICPQARSYTQCQVTLIQFIDKNHNLRAQILLHVTTNFYHQRLKRMALGQYSFRPVSWDSLSCIRCVPDLSGQL